MKRSILLATIALIISVFCASFSVSAEEAAAEAAGFDTNLTWKSVQFAGNDFEVREDGIYTGQKTNTVFVRSDKYIDGSTSFTMEYDVEIISVVDDEFIQEQGWLYYTFSLGLPDEAEEDYTDNVKNALNFTGLTILPYTRGGVYVISNTEKELPEEYGEQIKNFKLTIEYAASFEEIIYYLDGEELDRDYFNAENHEGYLGIETAWTEMKVTKAVYTEYPDGLPSEQVIATEVPVATEAPETTEAPEATEVPTEAPKNDDKTGKEEKSSPAGLIIGIIAAAVVIAAVVFAVIKKRKK